MEEQKAAGPNGMPNTRGKRPMKTAEYAVFFNDLYAIATDKGREPISPLDLLQVHGFDIDLPPKVAQRLMPMLKANRGSIGASECGACGVCGACALCGEINLGTPGAAAAAIWAIL